MELKYSIFNLKRISLILGTACNFNCLYCIQHENKPRCKKVVHPEVINWLLETAYKLPAKLKPRLLFYGGEPLLYREAIHQVVDICRDKFHYCIISNGANLTDEDVDYFNEHDISFTVSNDGYATEQTRQIDIFKDEQFKKCFNRLKSKSVSAVRCGLNPNVKTLFDSIDAAFPGVAISTEGLTAFPDTQKVLTDFDMNEVGKGIIDQQVKLFDCIKKDTEKELAPRTSYERDLEQRVIKIIKADNGGGVPLPFPNCGVGKHELGIDLEGNVYLCKNFNVKIGTIEDSYETLSKKAEAVLTELNEKNLKAKGCFECPVFDYCRGRCPFEPASERQAEMCRYRKTVWLSTKAFIDQHLKLEEQKQ